MNFAPSYATNAGSASLEPATYQAITETPANFDSDKPDFGRLVSDEARLAHYRQVLLILRFTGGLDGMATGDLPPF